VRYVTGERAGELVGIQRQLARAQMLGQQGRGRFAGCILAVASQEPSYWVLEGDETIRRDGEKEPGWRGTRRRRWWRGT